MQKLTPTCMHATTHNCKTIDVLGRGRGREENFLVFQGKYDRAGLGRTARAWSSVKMVQVHQLLITCITALMISDAMCGEWGLNNCIRRLMYNNHQLTFCSYLRQRNVQPHYPLPGLTRGLLRDFDPIWTEYFPLWWGIWSFEVQTDPFQLAGYMN